MRLLLILGLIIFSIGCNKPDPTPELKDEIYTDLNTQLELVKKELEAEEKTLEEHKKTLKEVVPQTGQIKFAQKRVFDSETRIVQQKQNIQWLKIRLDERLRSTRRNYAIAFKKGEKWPDPAEFEQYSAEMKLRRSKREWSVADRMKKAGVTASPRAGDSPKKKETKAEGTEGGEKTKAEH